MVDGMVVVRCSWEARPRADRASIRALIGARAPLLVRKSSSDPIYPGSTRPEVGVAMQKKSMYTYLYT